MATAQPIYEGNDTVDDTLLNQISKHVFYDELPSLARDLEVWEMEIRKILRASSSPQEQIFKVLHTWINQKTDFKVKDLVQEMLIWQKEHYLDRQIWEKDRSIFSPNLLPSQSSVIPDKVESNSLNPTALSDQERIAFEKEDLDPKIWVPKLCEHFNIDNLKLLKDVERERITGFLDGIKNTPTQEALRVLLWELRCLHVPSFELKTLTDLPDALNKRMRFLTKNRDEDDEMKFNELVYQLECTTWNWHQSCNKSYEFLTCLAIMTIFDFSLERFSFSYSLREKQIEKISSWLRQNLDELKRLKMIMDKQAFVLNIALSNPFNKKNVVQYILKRMPNKISQKFTGCIGQSFDLLKLHKAVQQIITRKGSNWKVKAKSLSMYFDSILSRTLSKSAIKAENGEVKEPVRNLLEDLGLMEYYPQKLSYSDVIRVTEDTCKGANEMPSSLKELPWFYLRRLIGLNSTIREKVSVIVKINERKQKRNPVLGQKNEKKGTKKRKLSEVEDEKLVSVGMMIPQKKTLEISTRIPNVNLKV